MKATGPRLQEVLGGAHYLIGRDLAARHDGDAAV